MQALKALLSAFMRRAKFNLRRHLILIYNQRAAEYYKAVFGVDWLSNPERSGFSSK
ncbi:hypothetical protein GGTG_13860 [Gaeumannomyces tritici R3-111a-1]|uniref:Uncharacterized protein n=1 Tax=Gaeumannomyces tritici (strain R3-111a-1) TaxID=644352 RepID=J3PK15_GAET3|nr:hypothetical protein GGTG_13860 [Gaeumannomyces tritici R3-111a-1]EJT68562.1 hypothetical protein GGTG_13860 [Gaeumannomyces tritici R3-111a-1]